MATAAGPTVGELLKQELARLWQECCQEQGVDPKSGFVCFDETSPLTREYNQAAADWLEYERQRRNRRSGR